MKKAVLILICILVLFVCSCSQSNSIEDTPEWDEKSSESIDFGGNTYYFSADIDPSSTTFLSYIKNTLFGDEAMKRFDDVEKKYNCKIEKSGTVKSVEQIFLHASASIADIDAYVEHIFYGGNEFKINGVLLPMSAVSDVIDLNDTYKWGTPNMLEEFTYKDEVYGILPMAWPENNFMSLDFLLVFNSNKTASLALEDPRDYLENGTWTRDTFEKVLRDYTYTDSFGNPVKAMGYDSRHIVDLAFKSFGVNLCEMNEQGQWESGYLNGRGAEAIDWVRKLCYTEYSDCLWNIGCADQVPEWVNGSLSIALLTSNFTFSTSSSGDCSSEIIFSDIPFAILPFPSEDGTGIISQHERTINAILFPAWRDSSVEAAMLVNDIFEPIAGLNTLDDMLDYYTDNLFFDRRDAELIFAMQKTSRYLFHDEGVNTLNRNIYSKIASSTGNEIMSSMTDSINTLVQEEIAPVKEGMYKLFGYKN